MSSTAIKKRDLLEDYRIGRKPPLPESDPGTSEARMPLFVSESASNPIMGLKASLPTTFQFPSPLANQERLLNAREVAGRLGVSERWVRDHTTRRSPKIRAVKLGTLVRYRRADVETFMENLDTFHASRQPRFGV